MLEVAVLRTDAEFDTLQREWDDLLESSDQQVFFLRWHWVRSWWRFYAPAVGCLRLVACRAGGRLVGLAPLYEERTRYLGLLAVREVRFLGTGGLRISEHVDIIARRGAEAEVGRAVAESLRRSQDWDRLWLWSVPATSAVFPHFRDRLGPGVTTAVCDHAYVVDTSRDWEGTKRGFRHDLDRALRSLLRDGGSHDTRVQTMDELQPALNDLIQLHQARWLAKDQPGSFAYPGFEGFLREAASDSLARGRLGLWRLTIGGRCVAALIAFVDFGTVHYFQSGFDPESPHSLGRIIVGLAIRDCVAAGGIRRFDLMGGEPGYKSDWTADTLDIVELELLGPSRRARLFKVLRAMRDRLALMRRAFRRRLRQSFAAQRFSH